MKDESLGAFIRDVCGEGSFRVEADLGDGFVKLNSSEAERRQAAQDIRCVEDVVIEMLRNARDADAKTIFLACSHEGPLRKIAIIDDGRGIPHNLHERIFEPRVTSKLDSVKNDAWGIHGRGMALYSIAVNAEKAYVHASEPGKGSSLVVLLNPGKVKEKADQSTFPQFQIHPENGLQVRGPKNIMRIAAEFAFESRKACTVFLGSPTEIAASLYEYGRGRLSQSELIFCHDRKDLPLCLKLSASEDPEAFAQDASSLGLIISSRSARRIMDGTLQSQPPLYERIKSEFLKTQKPSVIQEDKRKSKKEKRAQLSQHSLYPAFEEGRISISDSDILSFKESLAKAYRPLAEAYYLDPEIEPEIIVSNKGLRINLPFAGLPEDDLGTDWI